MRTRLQFRPVRERGQPRGILAVMSRALGRYELLRPLARGGMGEVYLARRRAAGVEKWLVVKRMRPERAGDARFLDLFMREAKLSMSLAHQNIVPVFDFGRIDDQVFLAMERIEGKDLGSTLAKARHGLSPLLAAFIAAECCQALDYAHRRRGPDGAPLGIVHRDVTPRNVLLSWSGEVKLTDFGIAALAGDARSSAVGTPAYMAPEQARGEPTDARADVYAMGLVLREAWTGVRARGGSDRESTLALAREAALEPWPEGFTGPLRDIVDRATAAAPDERYGDARLLLEALDAFILEERAGKKGDAPARQLAAWLDATWEEEREEGAIEEAIEGGHLVSFLDDGAIDVLGTGTQRSMAATAADEGPQIPPPEVAPPPVVEAPPPVEASRPKARSRAWLALLLVPIAAAGVFVATRSHDEPIEKLPPPARVEAPPVAHVEPPPPPPVEVKQPVVVEQPKPRKIETKRPVVKAGSAALPAPVVKHRVMIGSQPWSYFTVDGAAQQFESNNAIELGEGTHTIHFVGQPNFHADKTITIAVPAQATVNEKLVELPAP